MTDTPLTGWIENARISFSLDPDAKWEFNDRPFASIDGREWWLIDGDEHDRLTREVARLSAEKERLLAALDILSVSVLDGLHGAKDLALEARAAIEELRG